MPQRLPEVRGLLGFGSGYPAWTLEQFPWRIAGMVTCGSANQSKLRCDKGYGSSGRLSRRPLHKKGVYVLLVLPDLSKSNCSRTELMRLLDAWCEGSSLASDLLSSQLLAWHLLSSRFPCCLLCAGHWTMINIIKWRLFSATNKWGLLTGLLIGNWQISKGDTFCFTLEQIWKVIFSVWLTYWRFLATCWAHCDAKASGDAFHCVFWSPDEAEFDRSEAEH